MRNQNNRKLKNVYYNNKLILQYFYLLILLFFIFKWDNSIIPNLSIVLLCSLNIIVCSI